MKRKNLFVMLLLALFSVGCSGDSPEDSMLNPDVPNPPTVPSVEEEEPVAPDEVVYKTYKGLVMTGYQGWFTASGDPSGQNRWIHCGDTHDWSLFRPGHCSIEYWPDMREYEKKYPTGFTCPDVAETTAMMFSSQDYETIDLHFKWMRDYGIDGLVLQRFLEAVKNYPWMDTVLEHAVKAAKKYNLAFFIMYDLSGLKNADDVKVIVDDWKKLNDKYHFTDAGRFPNYLWEKGRPLVGLWGASFNNMQGTPAHFTGMMDQMVGVDGKKGALSYMLGTSYCWHLSNGDAQPFSTWEKVFKRAAIISPWAVGRYGADDFTTKKTMIEGDRNWCKANNVLYAPVVFPGFSWHNLRIHDEKAVYDAIPRQGGKFLWSQMAYHIEKGAELLYVAMFDEMDEGTCIFKCTTAEQTPSNATLEAPDGKFLNYEVASDLYLFLTGEAGKWLKGGKGYGSALPSYQPRE